MGDPEFILLGDALWTDFINTAATPPGPRDLLPDPPSLLHWTKAVKLSSPAGAADFPTGLDLRHRLLLLAEALGARRPPPASVIETLNGFLSGLAGREQLVRIAGRWQVRFCPDRPAGAFEAIALSAAETLAAPVASVRRCAARGCGLFLVDLTPNQSRLWCGRECCRPGPLERRRGPRLSPVNVGET
jgi:predicted RNA-binding Zn ribbon-like protein